MQPLLVSLALCFLTVGQAASAQETTDTNPPIDRDLFRQELSRLELICNRIGLDAEAEISRSWLGSDRSDQHRFYLLSELPAASENSKANSWRNHFISARKRYAAHLFEQAAQRAAAGEEAAAYRLLWQTLREDPEHSQTLRLLGSLSTGPLTVAKRRGAGSPLNQVGPSQRWQTRNFEIHSRATPQTTQKLAAEAERFFAIWTQYFYELWTPPGRLKSGFEKKQSVHWPDPPRLKIVLLADRNEYLKLLGASEANIGLSVGYYSPQTHCSYFYWTDDGRETVFHELTHQLFAEASLIGTESSGASRTERPSSEPVSQFDRLPGAWCIEGIATYMESLNEHNDRWTVGGIESARLQTARYRALRDQYWPDWNEFSRASLADWKEKPDIALAYSHAAGLTHAILDLHPDKSAARESYFRYLAAVYAGETPNDDLLSLFGSEDASAQLKYRELMTITDAQLRDLADSNPHATELVLSRSQLHDWEILSKFRTLSWLDVSFSNISMDQSAWLGDLKNLHRLSVEGTVVNGSILPTIAKLENLTELDLSLCAIDDDAMAALANHPNLETLWLTRTQVSDRSLATLRSIKKLKQCDVEGTAVTKPVP